MPGKTLGKLFVLLAGAAIVTSGFSKPVKAEEPSKVLRHMVLYKFKDDLSREQVQEVIDAFAGLPEKIPAIIDFEHGPNVSNEGKSEGLTYAFVVTFKSQKDLEDYLVHPAHKAYVEIVKDRREKVVVFDYWTQR